MKKITNAFLAFLIFPLVFSMGMFFASSAFAEEKSPTVDIQAIIKTLQEQIKTLQAQITDLKSQLKDVNVKVESINIYQNPCFWI